ncbi:MAG: DUF6434 domain-containing protein [Myxococcota bacterium]
MGKRPALGQVRTGAELRRWYWLKDELVAGCRARSLPLGGRKAELLERLATFLDTGRISRPRKASPGSGSVDWVRGSLSPETLIDAGYRNNRNVRRFMEARVGPHFRFTIGFMAWVRQNHGKSLQDAATAWCELQKVKAPIAEDNQFNRYLRAFFEANPERSMEEARICWAWCRSRASEDGRHRYADEDLRALGR